MYRSRLLDTVKSNRCLILILAVALLYRLILAVMVQRIVDAPPVPRLCLIPGDAEGYWELAQKIVAGKDYAIYPIPRYVLRVPGFPVLLAFSQVLFGAHPFAARCLLACVGTAACGLTYWLGRELADSNTGLIAATYAALSPTQALFSVLILSETTFAATLLASLIAIARFVRTSSDSFDPLRVLGGAVVAGLLIGVATLVRPTWLYVGTCIAMAVLLSKSSRPSNLTSYRLRIATGLMLGIIVSMTPWTCRNYIVTKHLVPTTLWVGPSLYDGLHPGATGDSDMQFIKTDGLPGRMSEYEVDREYRHRAWQFVFANPVETFRLALIKQLRYWSLVPNADQFQQKWLQWGVCLTVLPLFLCGACGIWFRRRDPALLMLTIGPVLLFAALHLLFVGSLRYRLPAEFPLAVVAAIGVQSLFLRRGPTDGLWNRIERA